MLVHVNTEQIFLVKGWGLNLEMVIEVFCAALVCDFQVVFIFISHDLNALLRRNTNIKLNALFFTWELFGRLWRSERESLGLCKIRAFIR